jgi:hypothetical protein
VSLRPPTAGVPVGPPLLLMLLPAPLEAFPHRARAEELLAAPGVLAIDPARVSYRALGGLPAPVADAVARRQAKRMQLPGVPRAIAVFDRLQLPLGLALVERHAGAQLWHLGPRGELDTVATFAFDLEAAADLRPAWEEMEALGVESGRLGSERRLT